MANAKARSRAVDDARRPMDHWERSKSGRKQRPQADDTLSLRAPHSRTRRRRI